MEGEEGLRLLAQSVEAYRQALQVFTREALPQDWAKTQRDLGLTLHAHAERLPEEEGTRRLEEALQAFQQALTVFTPESSSRDWKEAHEGLRQTQQRLAQRRAHPQGTQARPAP